MLLMIFLLGGWRSIDLPKLAFPPAFEFRFIGIAVSTLNN